MGQAAGKALSAGRRGSFSPNGERMWAGRRLVLTFLLAAVSEVVVNSVAPPSLEATLAEWGHGGGCKKSFPSEQPPSGWAERDRMGKLSSTGKGSKVQPVAGCETGP